MQKISDIFSPGTNLHHAYIIVGEPEKVEALLIGMLEQRFGADFISSANPDFGIRHFPTWGVDESRELKSFSSSRPVSWPVKILLLTSEVISFQAQNSLLKTLEEPPAGTHFFIITRRLEEYLATVISRCQVVKLETDVFSSELVRGVEEWLKSDIARRFEITKDILKQQEINSVYISGWLNCLLDVYWGKVSNFSDKKVSLVGQALLDAIAYANQRGCSNRLILEHLSGIVPVM